MLSRSRQLQSTSRLIARRFVSVDANRPSPSDLPPLPLREKPAARAKFSPAPRPADGSQSNTSSQQQASRQSQSTSDPLPSSSSPSSPTVSSSRRQASPLALPYLFPRNFGQNQVLSVPDSTRALLEEITNSFDAPIRYAFAYGSGVFKQDGSSSNGPAPLLDFVFAVNHPAHWHSINLNQYPSHYPLHARLFGSSFVANVQSMAPGLWFNAYVPMSGTMIKYGVTTVDNLCNDLLSWKTLYLAGRMHKPIRIIKDDARVRLTQQVNLVSALRVALLTIPESKFDESILFERMAGFSYGGDPRMLLPAENRGKVSNIVKAQGPQFRELYQRLANGLPGVHWGTGSSIIEQDTSPRARAALLRKLPANLFHRLESQYSTKFASLGGDAPSYVNDAGAFWSKVGADNELDSIISGELRHIVRGPATMQSAKGLVTSGLGKSVKYGAAKVGKWWRS